MSLKVIVTIPVYNGETTIKDALLSAINQSVEPDSIIISDNNSTDKTRDIVNEIISENTEIDIKLYKNITNIGYHKNLNKCLEYSKGYNYLVILYADDVLKRNMIKEQLDFLTGHSEFGLVGSKEDVIDGNNKIISFANVNKDLFFDKGQIFEYVTATAQYIADSSIMYDRKKLEKVGLYATDTIFSNELFNMRVLQKFPIGIRKDAFIFRRVYEKNQAWDWAKNRRKEYIKECRDFESLVDYEKREEFKEKLREYYKNRFSRMFIALSSATLKYNNDVRGAFLYLFWSMFFNYRIIFSKKYFKSTFLIILKILRLYTLAASVKIAFTRKI